MSRIRLKIEYDGSAYSGWQKQKNSRSIQGELERALAIIYKRKITLTGSGRTDAGVHARNQIAHCDIRGDVTKDELIKITKSLNGLVDKDIVVKKIEITEPDFHSRFDAKSRVYKYYISKIPTSIGRNFSWYISYALNFTLMQKAADDLLKIRDFKSFCKTGSSNKTTLCSVIDSNWEKVSDQWAYQIEADRFLYGMVRGIVGTLTSLGNGKISYEDYLNILDAKQKKGASFQAPPCGLFLEEIKY